MYEDDTMLRGWVRICATDFDKLDYSPINPKGRRELDILWVDALLVLDKKLSTLTSYIDKAFKEPIERFNKCLQKMEKKNQDTNNITKVVGNDILNLKYYNGTKKEHNKIARGSLSINPSNLISLPEDKVLCDGRVSSSLSSSQLNRLQQPLLKITTTTTQYNTIGHKFLSHTSSHGSYYPNLTTKPMFSSQLALSRQDSSADVRENSLAFPVGANPGKKSLFHQRRGSLPVVSVLDSSSQIFLEKNGYSSKGGQSSNNMLNQGHNPGGHNTQTRISDVFNGLFRVKSIKNNLKRTKSAIKLDGHRKRKSEEENLKQESILNSVAAASGHGIRNCRSQESLAYHQSSKDIYDLSKPSITDQIVNKGEEFGRNGIGNNLVEHHKCDLKNISNTTNVSVGCTHKTVLRQPYAFQLSSKSPSQSPCPQIKSKNKIISGSLGPLEIISNNCINSKLSNIMPQIPPFYDYYSCHGAEDRTKWVESIRETMDMGYHMNRRKENCLQIWILEAKGVPAKKRYFCEIYLDHNLHSRTASKMKGELCFWGETFDFKGLPDINMLSVHFYRDYGEKKKKRDKVQFIGSVNIPVEVITGNQFYEKWYPVNNGSQTSSIKSGKQDKASIRIKARFQTFDILPIHLYTDFLNILTEDYMMVCQYLESQVSVKTKEDVAASLVYIFEHFGMAEVFLTSIVEMEVNKLENESLTFRGNSLATKSIEAYMKYIALPYLRKTLSDFITVILDSNDDCEVDPTKVTGKSTLYRNQQNLTMYCEMAWSKIINSYSYFPMSLKKVFQSIRKRLEASCHKPEISDNVISASIFLRFLCPAILSPSLFGLVQEYPQERAARNLTLIAKTLQTLANSNKFGGKEGYMNFMNHFVEREWINMKCFLRKISSLEMNNNNNPNSIRYCNKTNNTHSSHEARKDKNGHYNNNILPQGIFTPTELHPFPASSGSAVQYLEEDQNIDISPGGGWDRSFIDLGKELSLAHSRLNETLDKVRPLPVPDDQFYIIHNKLKIVLDALEKASTYNCYAGDGGGGGDVCIDDGNIKLNEYSTNAYENGGTSYPPSPLIGSYQTNAVRRSLRFRDSILNQKDQLIQLGGIDLPNQLTYRDAPLSHINTRDFSTPIYRKSTSSPFSHLQIPHQNKFSQANYDNIHVNDINKACDRLGDGIIITSSTNNRARNTTSLRYQQPYYEGLVIEINENGGGYIKRQNHKHIIDQNNSSLLFNKNYNNNKSVDESVGSIEIGNEPATNTPLRPNSVLNRRNTDINGDLWDVNNRILTTHGYSYGRKHAFTTSSSLSASTTPSCNYSTLANGNIMATPPQLNHHKSSLSQSEVYKYNISNECNLDKVNDSMIPYEASINSDTEQINNPSGDHPPNVLTKNDHNQQAAVELMSNFSKGIEKCIHSGSQLSLGMASSGYHTLNTKHVNGSSNKKMYTQPINLRIVSCNKTVQDNNDDTTVNYAPDHVMPNKLLEPLTLINEKSKTASPNGHFSSSVASSSPYSSANEEENGSLNSSTNAALAITNIETINDKETINTSATPQAKFRATLDVNSKMIMESIENMKRRVMINGHNGDDNSITYCNKPMVLEEDYFNEQLSPRPNKFNQIFESRFVTRDLVKSDLSQQAIDLLTSSNHSKFGKTVRKDIASQNINRQNFPNCNGGGKFLKNPISVIDPILPKYNSNGRTAHKKINNQQYGRRLDDKTKEDTSSNTSIITDRSPINSINRFESQNKYHLNLLCESKNITSDEMELNENDCNNSKTAIEYEIEIETLRTQMRSLQLKLYETEKRLQKHNPNIGVDKNCRDENVIDEYKKEKDHQMGIILNRLMVLEKELRSEHEDIHSTVKDKQMIIEAQEKKIRELGETNGKLLQTLDRMNNGSQLSNCIIDIIPDRQTNEQQPKHLNNNKLLNGAAMRLSGAHHLARLGPPGNHKTVMNLIDNEMCTSSNNINNFNFIKRNIAADDNNNDEHSIVGNDIDTMDKVRDMDGGSISVNKKLFFNNHHRYGQQQKSSNC